MTTVRILSFSLLATLTAAGCSEVKSSPAQGGYLREGPAIAQSRERRKVDQQKMAEEKADAQRQEIAAATQAAVAEATRVAPPPAVATSRSGQVEHVVVMWLKKPGDASARKALLAAGETFKQIPGVISVSGGEVVKSDRAVVDSSYDVAFVVTFQDAEALKAYGPHPIHQKAVEEVVKPNVEKYMVYDFVVP